MGILEKINGKAWQTDPGTHPNAADNHHTIIMTHVQKSCCCRSAYRGLVWQIAATAAAEDEVEITNKKKTNQENNQAKENLFIFNSAKIKCFPSRAFTLNYVNFPPFVLSGENENSTNNNKGYEKCVLGKHKKKIKYKSSAEAEEDIRCAI
jgi:hypothetical protein